MVQINFAKKQVNAKVVYYGPGMSGKTTNLEVIHQRAPEGNRGELTSISTEGDRTLFFDFMPLDLGTVAGMRTCFQIYTVPGQVYYSSTRKLVLQGVDGLIFVADSSPNMMEENLESLRDLAENLAEYGRSIEDMPLVIQYNKRDVPGALSIDELEEKLNPTGVPAFEAIANTGQGVFPTLKAVAASVLDSLHRQQGEVTGSGTCREGAEPGDEPQAAGQQAASASSTPMPVSAHEAPAHEHGPTSSASPTAGDGSSEAARPTIPMSQTGFHEAPSVPISQAGPAGVEEEVPPVTSASEEVSSQGLRMAPPQVASSGLQMKASEPVNPPAPAPQAPQAPQPTHPVSQVQQPVAQSAVQTRTRRAKRPAQAAASTMEVEAGATAPKRRAPNSRSFPSSPAMPEARPTPKAKRNAMVTGVIIVASVLIGAILGSFVLSIL